MGASAGGLDACRKFLDALPPNNGMAFILVQHLDPTHESMMVELLASHTAMSVRQAAEGMPIEPDHLYIIPPGAYLSVGSGTLHLSAPNARHGARLPFDFLLQSLASEYGPRAVGVVFSGTGSDGSLGLEAVKGKGGFAIVQDPDEAAHDGMPQSAIGTGMVDLVLPVADIPEALAGHSMSKFETLQDHEHANIQDGTDKALREIIKLLRAQTAHDFTLYKPGTLQRRIARRMAMAVIGNANMDRYLEVLQNDKKELEALSKDLLIHVTSFFRDTKVFDYLEETAIPELISKHKGDQPIRIWIAGCSTGEETYSLIMLFQERIKALHRNVKLQVFASDIDPDAVAAARDGVYPATIEAEVSAERLERFFIKEEQGYRISPDLRAAVVFTVQDVLSDPPFSRLDMISCRNLLIYLGPEAQAKVIALFRFALKEGGFLLLGSVESPGDIDGRFELISKAAHLYRSVGRSRPGELHFLGKEGVNVRLPERIERLRTPSRQAALGNLCQRLVLEACAPPAVLINAAHECLYFLGSTDRFLQVAEGAPSNDLFAIARKGVRIKLRAAIQKAREENRRVVVSGGQITRDNKVVFFSVSAQPVPGEDEALLLICFLEEPQRKRGRHKSGSADEEPRSAELERELEATRLELEGAIRNLEISSEEQKTISEEALSVSEEFQSTNEELLTSKEELQSLNEELTALNHQLQETLERERTTSDDLQNILYSTDIATLFLDPDLNIRFYTPVTRQLFSIIPTDVGRPLGDLRSLAADAILLDDAHKVLDDHIPIQREIEAQTGIWYNRRIFPYRARDKSVKGVVITFADITEQKRITMALQAAKADADQANIAKSRFLAAASHDLRQPLQTLALVQGVLEKTARDEGVQKLVALLGQSIAAMSSMLNTLLDINQLDTGAVQVVAVNFRVGDLFEDLREEFTYQAEAHGLEFHVVPCSLTVQSDPHLLEQMIRNILSNALKYTRKGKVLLGCRRHDRALSIEVWDTGIGIAKDELEKIFNEYHQIDNPARERSRGLGLGLSIVKRIGELLDHRVNVRSSVGKGSVFSIEVQHNPEPPISRKLHDPGDIEKDTGKSVSATGSILIIEDDPNVRELLDLALRQQGHRTTTAPDGPAALDLLTGADFSPDLILADYNLPNGMNGLDVVDKLREAVQRHIPAVLLTGDISTEALTRIAASGDLQLNKPVKVARLEQAITTLLGNTGPADQKATPGIEKATTPQDAPAIYIVDDDLNIRTALRAVLESEGFMVEDYASCKAFLDAYRPGRDACLLLDAYLPGMSGLELLDRLHGLSDSLPTIMITGSSDVSMAVRAMKAGAYDFIEKPVSNDALLAGVSRALELSRDRIKLAERRNNAASTISKLTRRQREIMDMVLAGHPSKNIAADLGISQRTVENHRATIMKKTGTKSLPALARLALIAARSDQSVDA